MRFVQDGLDLYLSFQHNIKKKAVGGNNSQDNWQERSIISSLSHTQTSACTNTNTHCHTYKCPCSKCCTSHDIQETPQLPSFCLEKITLMHHMTPSWLLFPALIKANSPLTHLLSKHIQTNSVSLLRPTLH